MTDNILSIVIPCFNNWNFTKNCLNDLSKLPNTHQIIVVDNGSSDDTIKLKNSTEIVYVRNDINMGFAIACNKGYQSASSPNVLFLNNDIRVMSNHNDWTKNLIQAAEDGYVAGPTGGLLDEQFNFVSEVNSIKPGNFYLSGWNIIASKKTWNVLDTTGNGDIFSTKYGLAFFEDTDLGFRIRLLNVPMKIVNVPVHHFGHMTAKKIGLSSLYLKSQSIFKEIWAPKK